MARADLPPLNALRAFEAAARLMSFTKASVELGMTQAAVSYQIKLLEDHLGEPLFLRQARQVVLSGAGARLAPAVSEAFSMIRNAYAAAGDQGQATLVITTFHTFAANWLMQHIGAFQMANPKLAVRIDTTGRMVDFAAEQVDVGIRGGRGKWPGLTAHRLIGIDFTPMVSPKLIASIGGLKQPADLFKLRIIDPRDPWWTAWFTAAGVSAEALSHLPASDLGSQSFVGAAAIAGHGVAILTPSLFANEIADGRLVQPFALVCERGDAYWLVYPDSRRNVPKIKIFRDWIVEQFEGTKR